MQKRKGFNPEHSSTFAKALSKINVPEDFVRNPDRIDSIRWYSRLQDSQAPGPSSVSESVEAPTEVSRRTPKSPTTSSSSLVYGKWLKHHANRTFRNFDYFVSNPSSIKYNVDYKSQLVNLFNLSIN